MKTDNLHPSHRKRGVALIIVLGLLTVLTILGVAFAIAMRVERLAARNYVSNVRAEQLIQTAVARTLVGVTNNMRDRYYPSVDILASTGTKSVNDMVSSEAEGFIPGVFQAGATATTVGWEDVTANGKTIGRVSYLAVNCGGLIDANVSGGNTNLNIAGRLGPEELDLSSFPEDISSYTSFINDRAIDKRYETLNELRSMNTGVKSDFNSLFVFSYDPAPDMFLVPNSSPLPGTLLQYFPKITNALAIPGFTMHAKFNINSITNLPKAGASYTQASLAAWVAKVSTILSDSGLRAPSDRPDDLAWNVANWLDEDYYPQCSDGQAYMHTEGGEAMPLISEISIKGGVFKVELWFPFVTTNDAALWAAGAYTVEIAVKQSPAAAPTTTSYTIDPMAYGTPTEFRTFPPRGGTGITQSNDPAINVTVKLNGQPVDNAMDRNTFVHGIWKTVPEGFGYQVDDPRSNGRIDAWQTHSDNSAAILAETLGARNTCTDTDTFPRQGLPIFIKNGPMKTVADIGYLYRSNLDDERPTEKNKWYWNTVNLLHGGEGAKLLDRISVNPTSTDANKFVKSKGLISINTSDAKAMAILFKGMEIGYNQNVYSLTAADAQNLAKAVIDRRAAKFPKGFKQYQDLVDAPPNSDASQNYGELKTPIDAIVAKWCAQGGVGFDKPNDKVREDIFRNIVHMITFRQNMFTVLLGAQVLAADGQTVEAEKRAVAIIYYDAYTGGYFTRFFKWLN
jgi:Tfp pilus assembly protein PilX